MSGRPATKRSKQIERPELSNRAPVLLLTIEQACDALAVSWKTWHTLIEPELKLVRLGRAKRVSTRELERWIAAHEQAVI